MERGRGVINFSGINTRHIIIPTSHHTVEYNFIWNVRKTGGKPDNLSPIFPRALMLCKTELSPIFPHAVADTTIANFYPWLLQAELSPIFPRALIRFAPPWTKSSGASMVKHSHRMLMLFPVQ